MTFAEVASYAQLLNVLLVPVLIWIVRLERRLVSIVETAIGHAAMDEERFATMRRDLERVEANAIAAHRRLDATGARPAAS